MEFKNHIKYEHRQSSMSMEKTHLFPTCQVRVVRFYVSCLLLSSSPLLLLLLNRDPRRTVFSVGPQPRPSTPSVPCRTSTTTIPAQCSLPDLNHDHPRPVFPAGPQPRVSTPSVPAGPHVGRYGTKNVQKKVRKNVRQVCYILLANSLLYITCNSLYITYFKVPLRWSTGPFGHV